MIKSLESVQRSIFNWKICIIIVRNDHFFLSTKWKFRSYYIISYRIVILVSTWNSYNYSSTGSFLDNGCQPADAVVTNGAMFKSPIVQNGSDAYPSSDLRKSSSLAGKIAAANGYTLGSDAILRNGHHRNSPTESIKNLNSKNSTLTTTNGLIFKDKSLKKERPSEEVVHQNGGHTLKPVNDQGMLTAKMQTLKSPPPSSDAYNSNANGKSNSHHYTESDSISSATKDSHKHVDFTSSVTKYVSHQVYAHTINTKIFIHSDTWRVWYPENYWK